MSILAKLSNIIELIEKFVFIKIITTAEAKNSFGELPVRAKSEPVSITRNGRKQESKAYYCRVHEYATTKYREYSNAAPLFGMIPFRSHLITYEVVKNQTLEFGF